jgi:hypothetical protein
VPEFLGGEGPSVLVTEDLVGSRGGLGASTSRTGLVAIRRSASVGVSVGDAEAAELAAELIELAANTDTTLT